MSDKALVRALRPVGLSQQLVYIPTLARPPISRWPTRYPHLHFCTSSPQSVTVLRHQNALKTNSPIHSPISKSKFGPYPSDTTINAHKRCFAWRLEGRLSTNYNNHAYLPLPPNWEFYRFPADDLDCCQMTFLVRPNANRITNRNAKLWARRSRRSLVVQTWNYPEFLSTTGTTTVPSFMSLQGTNAENGWQTDKLKLIGIFFYIARKPTFFVSYTSKFISHIASAVQTTC